jgi:hypothetical protein
LREIYFKGVIDHSTVYKQNQSNYAYLKYEEVKK